MALIVTKKDKIKVIRSIVQFIILILVFFLLVRGFFDFNEYQPYDKEDRSVVTGEDNGFHAISYLSVDREGSSVMISTNRFKEHLKALYNNGYVTITQEDIENYYNHNIPLPKKALFLIFEDGRKDTAFFAQKIMEEYNYKGTILNLANTLLQKDTRYLKAKDLLELKKNSYWELGSNGYRFDYINVFDRDKNYLGRLTLEEFNKVRQDLSKDYNQYLMDYIRDENAIPIETYNEMKERIDKDYKLMEDIYTKELGEVPKLFVFKQYNASNLKVNDKVGNINEKNMKELFRMNFNRRGESLNTLDNDLYELTRMLAQPYWYTNHLLMRISDDLNQSVQFEYGNEDKLKDWDVLSGAPEFKDSSIVLTSQPKGKGFIRLNQSKDYYNVHLSCVLAGNKLGRQSIYFRADEDLKQYISVTIMNNNLYIEENGIILFELNLDDFDGIAYQKEETPSIQLSEASRRKIDVYLEDNKLRVDIDKKTAARIEVSVLNNGYLYLESAWGEYGFDQGKIEDDVYDGVFEELLIRELDESNDILYEHRLNGLDLIVNKIESMWTKVINWFIKNL